MAVSIDCFHNTGVAFITDNSLCHEQGSTVNVIPVSKAVLYIGGQAFGEIAAVFFYNGHLTVTDFDTGLQGQQIGTKSCGRGTPSALYQIIQLVNQEAGFHLLGICTKGVSNGIQIIHGIGQFTGLQNDETLTDSQIFGIHDPYIVKFFRSQTGALIAGGEAGTEIYMNDAVIILGIATEDIFIFTDAGSRGGAEGATVFYMGKNISRVMVMPSL